MSIRVSVDGRHFVDAAGQPFFWLGDTAWPLFGQYSRAEAERYLADRARKGFTVVQGVLAWGGGTGFERRSPGPNFAGHVPWRESPAQPEDAYRKDVGIVPASRSPPSASSKASCRTRPGHRVGVETRTPCCCSTAWAERHPSSPPLLPAGEGRRTPLDPLSVWEKG